MLATAIIVIGVLISLSDITGGTGGTWWLLLLSALSWIQVMLLRREIRTSGLLVRMFSVVSWALLGFAVVSLLSAVPARIIGDLLVLFILAVVFVGPRLRRAR